MKKNVYLAILLLVSVPSFSQTYNRSARELFYKGNDKVAGKDFRGAIEDYSRAIKLDSGFKQAYENRGVAKFRLGDNKGAIEDYTSALKIDPADYNTLARRGVSEFDIKDYTRTIEDITKAIDGPKKNIWYYNIRGRARYELREYDEAIADFNKVIDSWSVERNQKSNAFYWRGLTEINLGQEESGCADLKKAYKTGYANAQRAIELYCNK